MCAQVHVCVCTHAYVYLGVKAKAQTPILCFRCHPPGAHYLGRLEAQGTPGNPRDPWIFTLHLSITSECCCVWLFTQLPELKLGSLCL